VSTQEKTAKAFIKINTHITVENHIIMEQTDWPQILNQCRSNVKKQIIPLLKTQQPQLNLGIGAGGDPIKQVDLAAENAIVNILKSQNISFTLISEESGIKKYGKTPDKCYVTTDPIDGTTNLTRGIPFYATSIAVSTKPTLNTIHSALVADLFHDVSYTAQKGKGAQRNSRKITPSKETSLEEALIGLDLNTYKVKKIIPHVMSLLQTAKHLRHLGADALELCYVADGTTDAFIDLRGELRTTDMAAAWLIVQEAKAIITTPERKPLNAKLDPKQKVKFVAAANREIYDALLDLVNTEKGKK
jgi:myo-inositol-1(or 4)-monophosphatase